MRSIMVMNTKGGCGKSTLATNLASHYALEGKRVFLADFDPQGSSTAWLAARPENRPTINGLAAWKEEVRVPEDTQFVIMDVPAALYGNRLREMMRYAQSVIIPVLPSPMDISAAREFVFNIKGIGKVKHVDLTQAADGFFGFVQRNIILVASAGAESRLAVVANRVREYTLSYDRLDEFLSGLGVPFVTTLRETQNYIHAAERGLGIFEMAPAQVAYDVEQWEPLLKWLKSRRSLPKA